jgi:hypothetical protein
MTHTLVIETQLDTDYQLMMSLAHRLGLHVKEPNELTNSGSSHLFESLFGAWVSDETGDELAQQIRQARKDSSREIDF